MELPTKQDIIDAKGRFQDAQTIIVEWVYTWNWGYDCCLYWMFCGKKAMQSVHLASSAIMDWCTFMDRETVSLWTSSEDLQNSCVLIPNDDNIQIDILCWARWDSKPSLSNWNHWSWAHWPNNCKTFTWDTRSVQLKFGRSCRSYAQQAFHRQTCMSAVECLTLWHSLLLKVSTLVMQVKWRVVVV